MKKIETSKGKFIVSNMQGEIRIPNVRWFVKLSEVSEEQSSDIVDWNEEYGFYYTYPKDDWQGQDSEDYIQIMKEEKESANMEYYNSSELN